jgi:DNA-binding response OmpR family regulator
MKVLVADDDAACREMLVSLLQEWGIENIVVEDGLRAWEVMDGPHPPEMAILDWNMPGYDGFQLSTMIRAGRLTQGTYILLITAAEKKRDIMRVMVSGADDYLIKPFDGTDLKIRLRNGMKTLRLTHRVERLQRELRDATVGSAR